MPCIRYNCVKVFDQHGKFTGNSAITRTEFKVEGKSNTSDEAIVDFIERQERRIAQLQHDLSEEISALESAKNIRRRNGRG